MSSTAVLETLRGAAQGPRIEHRLRRRHFAPRPMLRVDAWADAYRRLSREASAIPGRWRTLPFQRAIMAAIGAPGIRRVVAMLPSQVAGKTEILLNVIGRYADLDPCPMLLVEPTLEMASAISKDRIGPMFRDTPRLRGKIRSHGVLKSSDDTILHKAGDGWRLTLVGANSASGLAMRPIRILLFDEPDRYPRSAGEEGSVLVLGRARLTSFRTSAVEVITGTPTIEGESIIEDQWKLSDQREWEVPCPHCGYLQPLEWGGPDEPFGLKWTLVDEVPTDIFYLCAHCGAAIEEDAKDAMNERGEYVARRPGRDIAGFHMTAVSSPLVSWRGLITEWLEAQPDRAGDTEALKAFVNTRLARTWAIPGQKVDATTLAARRVTLPAGADFPSWVGVVTIGVDVQAGATARLEVGVYGWGAGEQLFERHYTLHGDTARADGEPYQQLDLLRTQVWRRDDGRELRVRATGIDAGDQIEAVSAYVRPRLQAGVYALKGMAGRRPVIGSRPGKSDKYQIPLWLVGTVAAKDTLFDRLQRYTKPGPGYHAFAADVSDEHLRQYGGERARTRRRGGIPERIYEPVRGLENHAIDCWVYGYAALCILGPAVRQHLGLLAASPPSPATMPPRQPRRRIRHPGVGR